MKVESNAKEPAQFCISGAYIAIKKTFRPPVGNLTATPRKKCFHITDKTAKFVPIVRP